MPRPSRSSPTGPTAPWRTCHQAPSPPTPPGWHSPLSAATCCAPPDAWPASPTPRPAAPPCAATSSLSPAAPPGTAAATSPCTCPKAGTASMNGPACSRLPAARPPLRPDQPGPGHRSRSPPGRRQPRSRQGHRTSRTTVSGRKPHPQSALKNSFPGQRSESDHPNSRGGSRLRRMPDRAAARNPPTRIRCPAGDVRCLLPLACAWWAGLHWQGCHETITLPGPRRARYHSRSDRSTSPVAARPSGN